MLDNKVHFGILGAGRIAEGFATAIKATNGQLTGIASRSLQKAEAFQQRFQVNKAYGNYQDLLDDPMIDCVYIATPHGLHADHMVMALKAKKHVLCEKAFTINAHQAKAIFQLAKRQQRFVMEAMWTRFLPTIQAIQKKVQDGIIGEIVKVDATLSFHPEFNESSRLFDPNLGGGALLDLGVYTLTMMNLFMGEPIDFLVNSTHYPNGMDASEHVVGLYSNRAAFLYSSFQENRINDAMIYGTTGWIKVMNFHGATQAIVYDYLGKIIEEIHYPHLVNGLEYEIKEVIECIQSGKLESSIMPWSETIAIMTQLDAIRKKMKLRYPQDKMH